MSPSNKSANSNNEQGANLNTALADLDRTDLDEVVRFWNPKEKPPGRTEDRRAVAESWMQDPSIVEPRIRDIGARMGAIVSFLQTREGYRADRMELLSAPGLEHCSQKNLEAALNHLRRRAIVMWTVDPRFESHGMRVLALPVELGDLLHDLDRNRAHGLFDALTLRGYLEAASSSTSNAKGAKASTRRQREIYRMYVSDSASVARVEKLEPELRSLVEKTIMEFGGILPRALFEQMESEVTTWETRPWREQLEKALVGTVKRLDLTKYGINHKDESLVIFNEVALSWLKRVAVPGDPDRPNEELSLSVDLVTNLSRFLAYIDENDVRFTVKGEIFKTTERRILQHLIPNPGRELEREEVLQWIYRFARKKELIDRTGERTVSVSSAGNEWASKPLAEQLQTVVEHMIGESGFDGELYHQTRMRRIFMRLLKRVDAGVWYDLMYVPFLTRNTYLASLDELEVSEDFADLCESSRYTPMEDVQRMAWNLVRWVRQRLFLAGVIDLGYDVSGRPVAMRLTPGGARLLGISEGAAGVSAGGGRIIVTPDFEVVLFPSGDDVELIYDLDRFSSREKNGHSMHFRISEEGVVRALRQGMHLSRIEEVLEQHSHTPVPQNVRYSIQDWGIRAGWMQIHEDMRVTCEHEETLKRFRSDPGVRNLLQADLGQDGLQLEPTMSVRRMQHLLRDLGYLVERAS